MLKREPGVDYSCIHDYFLELFMKRKCELFGEWSTGSYAKPGEEKERERERIKSPTETKLREYSVEKQNDMNHSGICIWKEREVNSSSITDTTRMIIQEVWNIVTQQSDLSSSPEILVHAQDCSVNTVCKNSERESNDQNWFSQKKCWKWFEQNVMSGERHLEKENCLQQRFRLLCWMDWIWRQWTNVCVTEWFPV